MSSLFRTALREVYARIFNLMKTPASFEELTREHKDVVVVTQSDSLVVQGMLLSLARRVGYSSVSQWSPDSEDSVLKFVSLHHPTRIEKIITHNPNQTLSTLTISPISGPLRSPPHYRMNFANQLGLLIGCRFYICVFGKPLTLSAYTGASPSTLTRRLRVDFYRNLKVLRGTPFQSLHAMRRMVLEAPDAMEELKRISDKQGVSFRKARHRAAVAFRKMAADPSRPIYRCMTLLVKLVSVNLFTKISIRGLDKLVSAVKTHTVVLVPLHRSHLDYILLGHVMAKSNLNTPVVAAGINLSFWPFGYIIRSVGGYFVKRGSRNDPIQRFLLRRYVTYLIKRGHLQKFFIEGGRSRSGKMRPPRLGLLSIMVSAYLQKTREEILFVPVSITYEHVIEDKVFGKENTGAEKEKENLRALLKAIRIFKRKYGEVLVNFADPIPVSEFVDPVAFEEHSPDSKPELQVVKSLGQKITSTIQWNTGMNLSGLVYTSLMIAPHYGLTRTSLRNSVKNLSLIGGIQGQSSLSIQKTDALIHFLSGKRGLLNDVLRSGLIAHTDLPAREAFFIPGNRRYTTDFYRNSVVHLFVNHGILSLIELINSQITLEQIETLHAVFEFDFMLPPLDQFKTELSQLIGRLTEDEILKKDGQTIRYNTRQVGIFVPSILLSSIESMIWAVKNIIAAQQLGITNGDRKLLLADLQKSFDAGIYLGEVTRTEAGSSTSLESAIQSLRQQGLLTPDSEPQLQQRLESLQNWQKLIRDWLIGGDTYRW